MSVRFLFSCSKRLTGCYRHDCGSTSLPRRPDPFRPAVAFPFRTALAESGACDTFNYKVLPSFTTAEATELLAHHVYHDLFRAADAGAAPPSEKVAEIKVAYASSFAFLVGSLGTRARTLANSIDMLSQPLVPDAELPVAGVPIYGELMQLSLQVAACSCFVPTASSIHLAMQKLLRAPLKLRIRLVAFGLFADSLLPLLPRELPAHVAALQLEAWPTGASGRSNVLVDSECCCTLGDYATCCVISNCSEHCRIPQHRDVVASAMQLLVYALEPFAGGVMDQVQSWISTQQLEVDKLLHLDPIVKLDTANEWAVRRVFGLDSALRALLAAHSMPSVVFAQRCGSCKHLAPVLAERHILFENLKCSEVQFESEALQQVVAGVLESSTHKMRFELAQTLLSLEADARALEAARAAENCAENALVSATQLWDRDATLYNRWCDAETHKAATERKVAAAKARDVSVNARATVELAVSTKVARIQQLATLLPSTKGT